MTLSQSEDYFLHDIKGGFCRASASAHRPPRPPLPTTKLSVLFLCPGYYHRFSSRSNTSNLSRSEVITEEKDLFEKIKKNKIGK